MTMNDRAAVSRGRPLLNAGNLAFALHRLRDETRTLLGRQAVDNLDDHIATLQADLDAAQAREERLRYENDWAAQFTCPTCGPTSVKMVTTKKTCLICDSGLIRSKHPRLAELESERDAAQAREAAHRQALKCIHLHITGSWQTDPDAWMDAIRERCEAALAPKESSHA